MTRSRKVIKNLLSEVLPQVVIIVLGLFRSKYYLDYLGENTVGLVNLFSQIIGYLSLVEGGIGQAVIYRLYHPTFKKDFNKVSEIGNGTRKIFKRIIIIILSLAVFVGFIIPFLIKDNQFDLSYIVINFVLYVISEIILYTTVFERSIYVATERSYKVNRIIKTSLIVKHICEILLAIVIHNISIIFTCLILISLLENIIIKKISKKDYPEIPVTKKEDMSVLKDVKHLMVHKVAGLVATNIDIILISKYIGLGKVLIYSTYLLYVNSIMSFTTKISRAMVGTIGNILLEDKNKAYQTFVKFNGLCFFMGLMIAGPFNMFINNFISIFYSGKVATSIVTSTLFTAVLVYNVIRIPLLTYTEGAGLFKETKICPIIESVANLALSIVLIRFYGINGCLIGTIVSLIVSEYLIKPAILYKRLFKESVKNYYLMNIKFVILLILQITTCVFFSNYIKMDNLLVFMIYLCAYAIINVAFNLLLFGLLKQCYIFDLLKKMNFLKKTKM